MKKSINQLISVRRSSTGFACYKDWSNFQISIVDGCIVFVSDGIEVQVKDGVTLEVKNIYPDENITTYTTVTYNAPDDYVCKEVYNGDVRKEKNESAYYALMLLKSYLLPHGTYY